jgi:hypothetical protein
MKKQHLKFFEERDAILFDQYVAFKVLLDTYKRGDAHTAYYELHFEGNDDLYDKAYRECYPGTNDEDVEFIKESVNQSQEKVSAIKEEISKIKEFTHLAFACDACVTRTYQPPWEIALRSKKNIK